MNWFQNICGLLPAPNLILHVGAGSCEELPVYADLPDTRVVLIEPQPSLAGQLRRKTRQLDHVEVLECAVGRNNAHAQINLFNLRLLSSLQNPTGLRTLFPGLKQVGQVAVEVRTLADIIAALEVREDARNWLVLDAPGAEPDVVQAIASKAPGVTFGHIVMRASVEPLYEGGRSAARLIGELRDAGYRQTLVPDQRDPDWPRVLLQYDRLIGKNADLTARIDALKNRVGAMVKARDDLQQELENQRNLHEAQLSESDRKLRDVTGSLHHRIGLLREALDQSERSLEESQRVHALKLDEISSALKEKETEASRFAEEAREQKERVASLEELTQANDRKLEELARELEGKEGEVARAAEELRERSERVAVLEESNQENARKLEELARELEGKEGEAARAAEELRERTERVTVLEESNQENARKLEDLAGELERKEGEAARVAEELRERSERVTVLEESNQENARKLEELAGELERKEGEAARAAEDLQERSERMETLEGQIRELQRESEERSAALESELEQTRADLSVSLRVQALREADLKELQERYSELVELKNQQHDLLVSLGQRLGAASEYLKALKAPGAPSDESNVTEGLVKALAGDLESAP